MESAQTRIRLIASVVAGTAVVMLLGAIVVSALLARESGNSLGAKSPLGTDTSNAQAAVASIASAAIVEIGDPAAEIQLRIAKATGNDCFTTAFVNRIPPSGASLDELVKAAGGDKRWLKENQMWAGTAEEAIAAFGAKWAGWRSELSSEVWIQVSRGGEDIGVQLLATKTPEGHTIWSAVNSVKASTSCGNE